MFGRLRGHAREDRDGSSPEPDLSHHGSSAGDGPMDLLSPDQPLSNPDEDRLGYKPFARSLAESIVRMSPQGLVMALYGPWGSGKTTVLKFVEYFLGERPEDERPIVVRFNPWWYSGRDDLAGPFFRQLLGTINHSALARTDLIKKIGDFVEAVGEVPGPLGGFGKATAKGIRLSVKDVAQLKDSVISDLRRQNRRILIIIDDIDRLTDDEVRQLFRLVKAVADFPNVTYLLAFDREVVVRAIEQVQGGLGEAFLEKIIQVPFELPLPDRISLRNMLFEKLDLVIAGTPPALFDKIRWGNVFRDVAGHGVDRFIRTPRDVVRFVNALSVTYPPVRGEVNAVDFIAVEALRVFSPGADNVVRENRDLFAGHSVPKGTQGMKPDELRAPYDKILRDTVKEADRSTVKALLTHLFPRLASIWNRGSLFGGASYGSEWESIWRKERRVCSPDVFETYFRFSVPLGAISAGEMRAMLSLAGDAASFGARLLELAGERRPDGLTRAAAFLEELEDHTEKDVRDCDIAPIVKALLAVGDDLLRLDEENQAFVSIPNDMRIARVIWQLLRRLDEVNQFQAFREAIIDSRAISTIVTRVAYWCSKPGGHRPGQTDQSDTALFTNPEHISELRKRALQKIREGAAAGSLIATPRLAYVLSRWQEWGDVDEAREWVQRIISDDKGLAQILSKFLQKGSNRGVGNSVSETVYYLDPKWLEPFLDPDTIVERVRRMVDDPVFPDEDRLAAARFLRGHELRQQGQDPSSPFLMGG
ncbi:MAG: KAP family NTPase [Chloroflexota bacterium]